MPRKYEKVEHLSEIIFQMKAAGATNRQVALSCGLTREQVKNLVKRKNRKNRLIANGYIPQKKGRPSKAAQSKEAQKENELAKLRMTVEVLRNFLLEIGRM